MNSERGHKDDEVLVFGETLVDEFPDRAALGGAPFNVAFHLRRLGLAPILVTRLGADDAAAKLHESMDAVGLDTSGVQSDDDHPTGRVRVTVSDGAHDFAILPDQAYDHIDAVDATVVACSHNLGLVYFGTLAQRSKPSREALSAILHVTDCPRFLDVNLRSPWFERETVAISLTVADVVKLNEVELAVVVKMFDLPGSEEAEQAAAVAAHFQLESVIVTCGERGAFSVDGNGRLRRVDGRAIGEGMVDTVGAGDGFAAVAILGLLRRWAPAETLERADEFARALCSVRGAVPSEAAFYETFLARWSAQGR